jgi:hypothetical protein
LLLGGQTVGSSLYLLLAPVVALWNDPQALLLFNRLLFLGMGLVLWWGIRDWVGPGGAVFAVFALVASERIVALSYWPIHPNFSLFFGFLYACAILRGTVDAHRGWLMFSGLLLGVLTQLHFSYFLLLPCHFLLVAFGNEARDRWTKPLAAAAVFIPLAPFLVIDAVQGFPNISQIVQRPRFHADYPNAPFGNTRLLSVTLGWPQQIGGPYSGVSSGLTMLLIGIGLAIGLGSAAARMHSGRGRMTPAFAATLLLCVPLFELTAQGLGYNSRHTLSTAPPLFILAAFGFAGVMSAIRATPPWIGIALVLPLIGTLGLRAADSTTLARVIQSEGEWAVDYRSRQAIATDLATRLDLSPGTYPDRTIWWWVGWSIDPAIYRDYYRSVVRIQAPGSVLAADDYVLVTGAAELPPYLASAFDDKEVRPVAGMHVHVAMPKQRVAMVLPSSNADTGVRLHPFLKAVDLFRGREEAFFRIGQQQSGERRRDLFLGTIADGRIKLVVTTEQSRVADRGRLRWCVDSPSLNGHYQEFKTVWRPRLVLAPESGTGTTADLAVDVLGSLLYKTPRCGEAWSASAGAWRASFMSDGVFDQSFMKRPDLSPRQRPLDFDAPLRAGVLPRESIAAWLGSRFGD